MGTTIPSSCSSSASRRWRSYTSGLPARRARSSASLKASAAFTVSRSGLIMLVSYGSSFREEYLRNPERKNRGELERERQARVVLSRLDGVDGLARNADCIRQVLLGPITLRPPRAQAHVHRT